MTVTWGGLLAGGVSDNNRRFTGETQDPTGLLYLRARWYDPTTGRFLTRDPVPGVATLPQTLNPYAYALNNPVLYTDPSGEFAFIPLLLVAAAGGFLGGVSYYILEAYLNAAPCTGMQWKWQEALFWGGVGTGIGAVIGTGIYGGWWVGAQVGWWGTTTVGTTGTTVLGHFPEYVNKAQELKANYFNIPSDTWNRMTDAERWAANKQFLDEALARGDQIILATPLDAVRAGSFLEREINYLGELGYTFVDGVLTRIQ